MPLSNIQVWFEIKNKHAENLVIKNDAGSRKKVTFAHRQRDVLLFELLNSDFMLTKLKSVDGNLNLD